MKTQAPSENSSDQKGLTIGELARRTGVNTATLRMWESRHGFPRARRLPSGHRRYDEQDVEEVGRVVRRRDAGVRLEMAIAEVTGPPRVPVPSVFATLRLAQPGLVPHRLRKSTLLGLSWALEDECCARAQQPWLFGAFQDQRFYRQASRRWHDLARTARGAWVMATFDDPDPQASPVEVGLPETSTMTREWSLVCLSPDFPATLAAWEIPGQDDVPDGERVFESLWSLDPTAAREAARSCAQMVADLGHDAGEVLASLEQPLPATSGDLRHATALFNRVLAYVDRVR